jgi:uncharacterized membrane protein YbhN (UPF0104 family)
MKGLASARTLQVCVGLGVSAAAVWLLLQQVSPDELGRTMQRAQPLPIAALVLLVAVSVLARTARWQVLFLPDRRVRFRPLLSTLRRRSSGTVTG